MEELDLSSLIETNISEEENSILYQVPSEDEVFAALRSIPKESSLGLDDSGSGFYLTCWEIVKEYVVVEVRHF